MAILQGAFVGVALAFDPGLFLEGAAEVELRVDDRPVAVDLDAFELGVVAAAAGGRAYWTSARS